MRSIALVSPVAFIGGCAATFADLHARCMRVSGSSPIGSEEDGLVRELRQVYVSVNADRFEFSVPHHVGLVHLPSIEQLRDGDYPKDLPKVVQKELSAILESEVADSLKNYWVSRSNRDPPPAANTVSDGRGGNGTAGSGSGAATTASLSAATATVTATTTSSSSLLPSSSLAPAAVPVTVSVEEDPDAENVPLTQESLQHGSDPPPPGAASLPTSNGRRPGWKLNDGDTDPDHQHLPFHVPDMHVARLLSIEGYRASDWLTAIPYASSTTIYNVDFEMQMCLRLGVKFTSLRHKTCKCGESLDVYAQHAMTCNKQAFDWCMRHKAVVGVLQDACGRGHRTVRVEPQNIYPESNKRPDLEITFLNYRATIDVSITHPASKSIIKNRKALREPAGFAAKVRESQKIKKYGVRQGTTFIPFVLETYGHVGEKAVELVEQIARETAAVNYHYLSERARAAKALGYSRAILRKISVSLCNGNSNVILSSFQTPLAGALDQFEAGRLMYQAELEDRRPI